MITMEAIILKDTVTGRLTDDEFYRFCMDNRDLKIERNNKLEIIIMSPTNSFSGKINTEILRQLSNWNFETKKGEVFDSSSGFLLPDRSVFSPDAAWVSKAKWEALTEEQKNSFAPVCPEFVIEVRSKSDRLEDVQNKMAKWISNGVVAGWIIDPLDQKVYLYAASGQFAVSDFQEKLSNQELLPGFALDLSLLR